jgi:hypothetical protein
LAGVIGELIRAEKPRLAGLFLGLLLSEHIQLEEVVHSLLLKSKQFFGDKPPSFDAFQVTFFTQLAYHRMSDRLRTPVPIPTQTGSSVDRGSLVFSTYRLVSSGSGVYDTYMTESSEPRH